MRTCAAPRPEQLGSVAYRDKLAAWQLPSKVNLLTFFSVVVVMKAIALIAKHCLRYCYRAVWMQEAGGLTTHVAFCGYLARYNQLAAEAPLVVGLQNSPSGDPGDARLSSNHNIMASNHCRVGRAFRQASLPLSPA
jgi:hypothetical protein